MTQQDARAFLERYGASAREGERLGEEILRWRSLAERTTRAISGMPGGGSGDDMLQKAAEEIAALQKELLCGLRRQVALRRQIGSAVDALGNEKLASVLRLRYIDGLVWDDVAGAMHYSVMQVTRLHRQALEQLCGVLGEQGYLGPGQPEAVVVSPRTATSKHNKERNREAA